MTMVINHLLIGMILQVLIIPSCDNIFLFFPNILSKQIQDFPIIQFLFFFPTTEHANKFQVDHAHCSADLSLRFFPTT